MNDELVLAAPAQSPTVKGQESISPPARTSPRSSLCDDVVIRTATAEDAEGIVACSKSTDRFAMSAFTIEIDMDELTFWISDARAVVLVAVRDSEIVGYAYGFCVSPKWFFFDAFMVKPALQGHGIGEKMYGCLREKCVELGVELIQGLVKDGHPEALKYWLARGFEEGSKCCWLEDWTDEG